MIISMIIDKIRRREISIISITKYRRMRGLLAIDGEGQHFKHVPMMTLIIFDDDAAADVPWFSIV